jgi:hypothetical protein
MEENCPVKKTRMIGLPNSFMRSARAGNNSLCLADVRRIGACR